MARTNRNNQLREENMYKNTSRVFQTAVYVRLSTEDRETEHDSIENQTALLRRFVEDREDLSLSGVFSDNGYTGTNFNRPAFQAMMRAVRQGKINCVVVKDLSRLGRNYMEVGGYLGEIFPELGVRFISLNDAYDSCHTEESQYLTIALKNVYHHVYSRDLSQKTKTQLRIKKQQGQFLGRYAPYGYQKSKPDHTCLEPEEKTAPVVRRIFGWYLEGLGTAVIARRLNDAGVPSQYRRLYETGRLQASERGENALWSAASVRGILTNPCYCGCMVEQKSEGTCCMGVRRRLPPEEWTLIEGVHEALVDRQIFNMAQKRMEREKKLKNRRKNAEKQIKTENVLRGLVFCGKCGRRMMRDSGYYNRTGALVSHYFRCSGRDRKTGECGSLSRRESDLCGAVCKILEIQAAMAGLILLYGEEKRRERNFYAALIQTITVHEGHVQMCFSFQDEMADSNREGGIACEP